MIYPKIEANAENDCLLGFAHNGSVATCFMDSVLAAFAEDARRPARRLTEYYPQGGPYIHENRALIARYFLECTDKQWLWMLDNDMDFPVDALYQLLEAAEEHDCRILGAAYWNQYGNSGCYLSWLHIVPHRGVMAVPLLPEDDSAPVELTACGMGCTLLHRSVLQDVADMHPNDPWDTFGADMMVTYSDGNHEIARQPDDFKIGQRRVVRQARMGEDVSLCIRAQKAGHRVYGLPSLVIEHYKATYMPHGRPETEAMLVGSAAI